MNTHNLWTTAVSSLDHTILTATCSCGWIFSSMNEDTVEQNTINHMLGRNTMDDISIDDEQILDVVIQVFDDQRDEAEPRDIQTTELGYESYATFTNEELEKRFGYHAGTDNTRAIHIAIRKEFLSMAKFMDEVLPNGRAKQVAFTELETAAMWSLKAVAELNPVVHE